jgi:coenzyme F420-reducing hydrogenase delta subunit
MAEQPKIVLIGCTHSAGAAIEELAASAQALPGNVEWVSIPCGSALDELHILRAFEAGADQVMVLACYDGACRSVDGNRWAEKRVNAVRAILEEAGIAGWRLAFHNIAPSMPVDLLQWLAEFREPVSAQEPQQGASA